MTDAAWEEYFGFDEPYQSQADAVETAIATARDGGYLALEGPCGTGKTMAALTAAATLVREDRFERVLAVTPVKQQLAQFVDDLRTLNRGLEEPLAGVSLVGKRDLCPLALGEIFPPKTGVQSRCEELREQTADLVEGDGQRDPAGEVALGGDVDDAWWDPGRGRDLAAHARPDSGGQQALGGRSFRVAGVDAPYRPEQPRAPEAMADSDDPPLYCAFEADWYARNRGSPVGFDAGEGHVVAPEDYLPAATEAGICPHRAMTVAIDHADVIVGNYNHLFGGGGRALLEAILDDRTFVIVDEAHRLEERVRDLLSDRVGRQTLVQARNDCHRIVTYAKSDPEQKRAVRRHCDPYDVPLDAIERARDFYDDLIGWIDDRANAHLDREVDGWPEDPPEESIEIPLRDPETAERDDITGRAAAEGYDGSDWRTLDTVGAAVEDTLRELSLARSPVVAAVGTICRRYYERDQIDVLREIELEYSPRSDDRVEGYRAHYTAGLVAYETLPAESLARTFDELGGGILMSATLSPLDVFAEVAGLDALDRPIATRSYPLRFPEANRASWIVDAPAYTAHNRGDPVADEAAWSSTRDAYAQILRAVGRSPGNALIAMPNYREARWAGEYLQGVLDRAVLIDQSSSARATDELKSEFFSGPGKVMVTSTRGTLTEGVDYDGSKLATAAVVGIPLPNVGSPRVRAVKHAYGERFGADRAFEYALTVPAVRRARQAIGRVIRGPEEVGVRILAGRRYVEGARHSVHAYLSPGEREEFVRMTPDFLADQIAGFWDGR
ncbi:ATP-dependent DNA helicase [Halococcoides cellulosivorans]|uniref:ATP-dependent DNA helicase n=1 Tax=Halococcoides cellulosivorans TaxID=1679096 RepID=A0A2R4WYM3_9EURY|nr:ATP-dependent DNA helicase [Halococcoides cellulosivorans]AWB26640.1 ATP-dependent DNA helicase [Halococcoides cellulosivorans]